MGASQVTLPTLWLALSSVTLVGVLVLVALVRDWRRRLRDARNELAPLRVQLAELGLQVRQLSAELQALRRAAVENNMGRGRSGGGSPYNQAIELVRQGVLAAEVARRGGLTRAEAELIVSLYRRENS